MRPPNPSTKSPNPHGAEPASAATPPPSPADNAMREIFLRVPADDPGSLVRAAAVCRSWCRILSDAAFARDYRAFRRAPPMLGFLHNERHREYKQVSYWVSHFVSTATFSPPPLEDLEDYQVLDSRHGLVLLHSPEMGANFVVWDLITHEEWAIHADPKCHGIMWWEGDDPEYKSIRSNAAVLCDKDLCDHFDCHGGPFLVALVGSDGMLLFASVMKPRLYLWSMEVGPGGAAGWARRRFIELEPSLPRSVLDNSTVSAVGYAEGVGVIFVSTQSRLYTIELSSGRGNEVNVGGHIIEKAMPYMSFYIGARGLLD